MKSDLTEDRTQDIWGLSLRLNHYDTWPKLGVAVRRKGAGDVAWGRLSLLCVVWWCEEPRTLGTGARRQRRM